MIAYQFLASASEEFLDAALFYESRLAGLGAAFVDEVQRAVDIVRDKPEAGAPFGTRMRRILVRRFPFAVLYRRMGDRIVVLAVAHLRRRPGYWRGRRG